MKITIGNDTVEFTHTYYGFNETGLTADVISSMLFLLSTNLEADDLKSGTNPSDDDVLKATRRYATIFAEIAAKCKQ